MYLSQVLGDELLGLTAAVNLRLEAIKGGSESGISGWTDGHDFGEFRTQQPCVSAGEEQSNAQAGRGNVIAPARNGANLAGVGQRQRRQPRLRENPTGEDAVGTL